MGSHPIEPFEVASEVVAFAKTSLPLPLLGPLLPAALALQGSLPPLAHPGPGLLLYSPTHIPHFLSSLLSVQVNIDVAPWVNDILGDISSFTTILCVSKS